MGVRSFKVIMKVLFIHQNFPAQFKHLSPALAARAGWEVATLTLRKELPDKWQGVKVFRYSVERGSTKDIHPWVASLETQTLRGEAVLRAALALRAQGWTPDVIVAHPGWGEALFLKDVWPQARLGLYCEFFYQVEGADVGFDAEFSSGTGLDASRLRMKNAGAMLQLSQADAGISPTHWQAAGFPESYRSKISVIHDGIDTTALRPNPMATVTLSSGLVLSRDDEVVTFLNRQLEPYRGFHVFMRALPALLKQRPKAHVVVVGGDGVSYGAKLPEGQTWRKKMMDEIAHELNPSDLARLHFVGNLPYSSYISLMQVSKLHVYLTYPLVLSWSLLEAMSMGCAILASATAPVQEVIEDNVNGCLIDFFDHQGLALKAAEMLSNDELRQRLGTQAREDVCKRYDLNQVCLPKMLAWVDALATRA